MNASVIALRCVWASIVCHLWCVHSCVYTVRAPRQARGVENVEDVEDVPLIDHSNAALKTVTFDRSNGQSLGFVIIATVDTTDVGRGARVKTIDDDSQAHKFKDFKVGLYISHINGVSITNMNMKEIMGVIQTEPDKCDMSYWG